jgi:hypothetical protein
LERSKFFIIGFGILSGYPKPELQQQCLPNYKKRIVGNFLMKKKAEPLVQLTNTFAGKQKQSNF